MTVIAQSGIFGFGPQTAKDVLASSFYRMKAADIDLAPVDDVRTGAPEIGGVAVPTIPYKAGSLAAGGATLQPRLENTLGWLLYAAMGGWTVSGSAGGAGVSFPELALRRTYLKATTQAITNGLNSPGSGRKLIVKGYRDGASSLTGNVTIKGTTSGSAVQEVVTLSDKSEVQTTLTWLTVTEVDLPVRVNTDGYDAVSVGWADSNMRAHTFAFDANNSTFLPWVSMRNMIAGSDTSPFFGIQYKDCKVTGFTFTLPNEGLIQARMDVMGRGFEFVDDPDDNWTWANTYEDYTSIPIGCTVGGYISAPSFGDTPLPVVNATVGIQNQPLDPRQERIFGSPDLEDITIVTRQLVFDVTAKWRNPDLYRAIVTGSRTGVLWSTTPFVKSLEVVAYAPGYATGTSAPYGIKINSDAVMWQQAGPIRQAGNQMVSMRLTGTALDTNGNYGSMTLINKQTAYDWPS